jgi:glyoxylase-like metal-dependent hydrolase (beta-lactamase superfamily II)
MMSEHPPLGDEARADLGADGGIHEVAPDIAYMRAAIVNVVFLGTPGAGRWVLVDAGLPGTAKLIERAAERRFGEGVPPAAILLTHGHFDHVGSLETLLRRWQAPVYAHPLERPYLDGIAAYPPPDPSVGGGLIASLSRFFPRAPIDLRPHLRDLPAAAAVPSLLGWQWLHTPGHTPGHVSFWRESDRALLAGDAVITTRQESAYAVLSQTGELHGPPAYFTQDWDAARRSVELLAVLRPEILVPGHGRAMRGSEMRALLARLAEHFEQLAVPSQGRYVDEPARVDDGSAYDRAEARGGSATA